VIELYLAKPLQNRYQKHRVVNLKKMDFQCFYRHLLVIVRYLISIQ
jgi:hypothetical protein